MPIRKGPVRQIADTGLFDDLHAVSQAVNGGREMMILADDATGQKEFRLLVQKYVIRSAKNPNKAGGCVQSNPPARFVQGRSMLFITW